MAQEAKIFKYQTPEFEGVKKSMMLCSSDLMKVMVQVVKEGGENNLHTHTGDDAFWYVINGAVKFYGEGDKLIGEFKTGEGILIPRGFQYWFESSAKEPLEILRVTARDQNVENKRINVAPLKPWQLEPGRAGA
jgi:mannose-6-phosphate isomerase-like protein (cupin superfamily)